MGLLLEEGYKILSIILEEGCGLTNLKSRNFSIGGVWPKGIKKFLEEYDETFMG